jgi:circadian clock protein KaiB
MRKTKRSKKSELQNFEEALKGKDDHSYVLRLYVTGSSPRSARAIANVRAICDRHLTGRYELEIIDVYQQPNLASSEQIIAAPTLVKKLPMPLRKIVGDMSNEDRVMVNLDLRQLP